MKDKYLQIFNYLLEFSKLRSNPVRDIESSDQYPEKVWLSDIPQCEIFDCVIQNYNQDADYWLKISKPKEPQHPTFPKLNETLTDWIVKESLTVEIGTPVLNESITKNDATVQLSDQPEITLELQDYINKQWLDDLASYKKEIEIYLPKLAQFKKQSEIYKQFFTIYNKVQQFGQEFELVFGAGLLYFREDANTPLICRHILTIKAEITFAPSQGQSVIKLSPSLEHEIQIETDAILDLDGQFNAQNINVAESEVVKFLKEKQISGDLFDKQIDEALQIFVNTIRADGHGHSIGELSKPKDIPQRPTIYLAPALLLRKRNTKSLTALYEKIIKDVKNADAEIEIPSINDIIGIPQKTSVAPDDGIIYFPKKYNDEQIQIIEKMRRSNKVLVQGPPGTGKSHTIANLICHLLANGKKVLVTAYTKRALEVLKHQLPDDFKNLTVNLLSGDTTSIQELNNSVNAINNKLASITNIDAFRGEIKQLGSNLSEIKAARAYTKNEWLKVKEQSTRKQSINPNYQGTLSEIAEKLENDSANFCWFKDDGFKLDSVGLIAGIEEFNLLTKHYQLIDCAVFDYVIPKAEHLLSLFELLEYQGIENKLIQNHPSPENYNSITCSDFQALEQSLEKLFDLFLALAACPLPFKSSIINGYPAILPFWMAKVSKTNALLADLDQAYLRQFERDMTIQYPEGKTWAELKNDATILLAYLNKGNRLNGIGFKAKKPFLPIQIKQVLYFIDDVNVLGHPCDTISAFETVLADIKIKQDLEELEYIWKIKPTINSMPYSEKAGYYRQIKELTESLIHTVGEISEIKTSIAIISSVNINHYENNKVKQLLIEADYHYLLIQKTAYNEKITDIRYYLSNQGIHPIAESILTAIEKIDSHQYQQYLSDLSVLDSEKEKYNHFKQLEESLQKHFPQLINDILQDAFDITNLPYIENAIYFKHAAAEITKQLEKDYESSLIEKLTGLEYEEEELISELGSKKAWLSVLERLNENPFLRENLEAWVQAVEQIGKAGAGKIALLFQREAQQQMEKCKDSIPCWVMPLYKVTETVSPELEMYDYVIVDEASQLGADALFLLYISKNIIIVGDDKQTSPEYVGVGTNVMTPHIDHYLQNIPFANFYRPQFSFFAHARRFIREKIVLREHFRCMPEIIEFSNNYFYRPDGIELYPLKQYSENRLEPLQSVYCQNGYIDGTGQNITNKIEAKGITDKIVELIKDERYKGKSFGVIALQGNYQAALIDNLILKKIGEVEYNNRNIICGNSASFQGDERDVMFLSLVTAHNHNRSAMTTKEYQRRFNVAVSRAKEQIWLFHSVQLEDLSNTNDLRYKLLNHFLNYNEQQTPHSPVPPGGRHGNPPPPFDSWFEVDVFNDIVTKNYPVIPQYKVANGRYRIDLVILLPNGIKIAVECDGDKYHGAEQFENDMMRQKVLERCGWQFFRVRGGEYYSNRIKALEPLWKLLSKNNIKKPEPLITTTDQPNNKEKIDNDTVEIIPPNKNPYVPGKQIDIFDKESKIEIKTSSKQKVPVDNRTKKTTGLFSCSDILVFTSLQNVYKIKNIGFTNQAQVKNKIEFELNEKPVCWAGTNNYSGYLLVVFENGKSGKIYFSSYQTEQNRKKLKNSFSVESKLIFIEHIEHDIDLILVSNKNKVILFNTEQITPVSSKTSQGVKVMRLKEGSIVSTVRKLNEAKVKLNDPEHYRTKGINVVGNYLKQGDEII